MFHETENCVSFLASEKKSELNVPRLEIQRSGSETITTAEEVFVGIMLNIAVVGGWIQVVSKREKIAIDFSVLSADNISDYNHGYSQ